MNVLDQLVAAQDAAAATLPPTSRTNGATTMTNPLATTVGRIFGRDTDLTADDLTAVAAAEPHPLDLRLDELSARVSALRDIEDRDEQLAAVAALEADWGTYARDRRRDDTASALAARYGVTRAEVDDLVDSDDDPETAERRVRRYAQARPVDPGPGVGSHVPAEGAAAQPLYPRQRTNPLTRLFNH